MDRKIFALLVLLIPVFQAGFSQTNLNIGTGYFGFQGFRPGWVVNLEWERFHSDKLSVPLRANLGYFRHPDYHAPFVDVHAGFRYRLPKGFFFGQSIGLGVISNFFTHGDLWYHEEYGGIWIPRSGANLSLMPSVDLSLGYDLSHKNNGQNLIWIRPIVFWNLGIRGLQYPFTALQIGFTHTIKTKAR
jgi:hypothetical protein